MAVVSVALTTRTLEPTAIACAGRRHNRRHASGHRPSFRLGRGRHGVGRPPGRGPQADRADRTRHGGRADPPRRQAARRRRRRGAGRAGAGVGGSSDVGCAGRARDRSARTDRLDVAASLAARLPRGHRRPTARAVRGPRRLRHVPPGAGRARTRTRLGRPPLRRQGRGGPSGRASWPSGPTRSCSGRGRRLGPPWAKDHRMALAATIMAGDDGTPRSTRTSRACRHERHQVSLSSGARSPREP